ncbi:MAG: hypothetical protein GXY48_08770 [Methanomicrobiales archaeon]|nr:hypothetical protein [Methanomicrobiales archaeon]
MVNMTEANVGFPRIVYQSIEEIAEALENYTFDTRYILISNRNGIPGKMTGLIAGPGIGWRKKD